MCRYNAQKITWSTYLPNTYGNPKDHKCDDTIHHHPWHTVPMPTPRQRNWQPPDIRLCTVALSLSNEGGRDCGASIAHGDLRTCMSWVSIVAGDRGITKRIVCARHNYNVNLNWLYLIYFPWWPLSSCCRPPESTDTRRRRRWVAKALSHIIFICCGALY